MGTPEPSSLRPTVPAGQHPVEQTRYVLATPAIDELLEAVAAWVDNRTPGGVIYGHPRMGKTRAIQYIMQALPQEFGLALPMTVLRCREYLRPSEGVFFEDVLRALGHRLLGGTAAAKRDRVTEYWYEQARASRQNRLILFVDDAQRLQPTHYEWLMDIYNDLEAIGVYLSVLLVGQPELAYQRSAFVETKKLQIVGRFMTLQHGFHGLRHAQDVRARLEGYDEHSEYPADSGWSFSRYFFPRAFETGWRLADSAEDLWEAFRQVRSESGLPGGHFEVPMQYFCRTVEHFLRRYQTSDEDAPTLSIEVGRDAVCRSGYSGEEPL
jgi:hypothetical protein